MRGIRRYLKRSTTLVTLAHRLRRVHRDWRTRYLVRRFPKGAFLACNGVKVFCDFRDPSYEWYDGYSPVFAIDRLILNAVLLQSEGNVLIDIGAHFGFYSRCFTQIAGRKMTKILALEPEPRSFRCLQHTMASAPPEGTVVLLPYAISLNDAAVRLYRTPWSSCCGYHRGDEHETLDAWGVSLDTLAAQHLTETEKIAFIKIDVDGGEWQLFAGGEATLRRHQPIVFVEFAPPEIRASGADPEQFFREICDRFPAVYAVSYRSLSVMRVARADYARVEGEAEGRITNLILWHSELPIEGLSVDL